MTKEVWKPVGETGYTVSDQARVKGLDGRELVQCMGTDGYKFITLWSKGVRKHMRVHRLVWITFNGATNGKVIDHIDENRTNNVLSNLQLLTHQENMLKHYSVKRKSNPCKSTNHSKPS